MSDIARLLATLERNNELLTELVCFLREFFSANSLSSLRDLYTPISRRQAALLKLIYRTNGELCLSELARGLGVDRKTVKQDLLSLSDKGIVYIPERGRKIKPKLTGKGYLFVTKFLVR